MKNLFALLVATVMVFSTSQLMAQKVLLGPSLVVKGGVNAGNIPEGQKTAFNFHGGPDFSANILYLFNKDMNIGIMGDIGYSTYSYRMRPESESIANDDNTSVIKPSYVVLAPSFFMGGFTIGVALGFPSSYSVSNVSGKIKSDLPTDNLKSPMIELRIGGMIPLYDFVGGRISIIPQVGYMVSGMVKEVAGFDSTYDPKIISGGLGVSYHFNLTNLVQ